MAKDIMQLAKEKLEALNNKGEDNGGKYKPKAGDQEIRITPSSDGDNFQERHMHYGVGLPFLCPKKNFGEACPVCDFASSLYMEATKESRALSSKIYAKPQYFSPVLVRGDEAKGIRWWQYSKTVYQNLLKMVLNPKFGNFTDIKKGFDFILTYTPGKGESFAQTQLSPDPSSFGSPLLPDLKAAAELVEKMPKLNTILTRLTTAEVQTRLDEFLASGSDGGAETEKYGSDGKSEPGADIDAAYEDLKSE